MTAYLTDDQGNTERVIGHLVNIELENDINSNHTGDVPDEYLLKNVSGYWKMSDPKASVKSAKLQYACENLAIKGSVNQVVYDKSVSNNFSFNTGFSVYVPKGEFGSMIGASLNLTYLMGTARTWTFTLQNLLDN